MPEAEAAGRAAARSVVLAHEVDWQGWRTAARRLALEGVAPEHVLWSVGAPDDLFASSVAPVTETAARDGAPDAPGFTVPRALVTLAQSVIQHRDPARFALLYRLLWRVHRGERTLLERLADPEVRRAERLARAVARDTHDMRAFLRFRVVEHEGAVRHVAWFEPGQYVLEANAPFFVRRFATHAWSILTPYRSAHWDGTELGFGPGASRAEIPDDDGLEAYWRTYYAAIFNPARLNPAAMRAGMARRYWRDLPEAAAIPDLVRTASARVETMVQTPTLSPPRPTRRPGPAGTAEQRETLGRAADEIGACRRCPLWQHATQPVFGEGPADARIMFVGEQPGDQEDLAGRPFVGPAGQLFDRALAEAGLDRKAAYVTNAVKHFKFTRRGTRRIHEKPGASEIEACRFWLDLEREALQPVVTVMLGATAARAVTGRAVSVLRERGRPLALDGNRQGFITVHPSFLLRLPDEATRTREWEAFLADLRAVRGLAA